MIGRGWAGGCFACLGVCVGLRGWSSRDAWRVLHVRHG